MQNLDNLQFFLIENGKKFTPADGELIRQRLQASDTNTLLRVSALDLKDPTLLLIISIFAGSFGVDRFLLGQTGLGVGKLLTLGGCGIWWLVDLILIMDATRKSNFEKIMPFLTA